MFSINQITFSEPVDKNGVRYVEVLHNGEEFILPTPQINLRTDIIESFPNETFHSFDTQLSLTNRHKNKQINDLYNFINFLENKIIETAYEQRSKWFNKEVSLEELKDLFKPLIKESDMYGPTIFVKIPFRDKKWGFDLIDDKQQKVDINNESGSNISVKDYIVRNVEVKCKLKLKIYSYQDRLHSRFELNKCNIIYRPFPFQYDFSINSDSD